MLFADHLSRSISKSFCMKYGIGLLLILFSMNSISQNTQLPPDWANLKRYAAENSKLKAPAKNEKRIVFMGNSITEFWKVLDSSFFNNPSYINRGISGQTTPQILLRFQQDVVNLKPAVVVIMAGINDIAQNTGPMTLEQSFNNIVSMVQLAVKNKIKVIVSSVLPANAFPWRPQIKPADQVIALNSMLQKYCKSHALIYLNYYPHMVDNEKGLDKKYSNDGVHPTLAGYLVMDPLVKEAIQKLIARKSK